MNIDVNEQARMAGHGRDPDAAAPRQPETSPALPPQPSHVDQPQNPLPGNPPAMPEPTPPETKPHPGL